MHKWAGVPTCRGRARVLKYNDRLTRNWDAQVMTEDPVPGAGRAEARRYEKQRGRPYEQRHSQSEGLSKSSEYGVGGFTEVLPSLFARSSSGAT